MLEITREIRRLIDRALEEDQAFADATTQALIDPSIRAVGEFRAEEPGILSGISAALEVFQRLRSSAETHVLIEDGSSLAPGQIMATVTSSADVILRGERLALNILQRMSGIATQTAEYVKAVEGTGARISVSTFDGELVPSFPVQFRGGRLRGGEFTVGDGSAAIALKSFDGDILLIRPGERVPDRDD